jgi:hypothetical protein
MIVGMRTRAQAAKVALLTDGVQLPGKPNPDGTPTLSRYVDVGAEFEAHRAAVESVSVLFELFDGDADSYAATGSPGATMPTGWMVTAAKFEVEWPREPQRAALVRSHFGARRFAFNWGLAQVKADLDAKAVDPDHESVDWDLGSLRKVWNRVKDEVAPWWAINSKEAYSAGLADLARALSNWGSSKNGNRRGRRVGFPRFQSGRRDAGRVRFSTGTMRLEADRRTHRDRQRAILGCRGTCGGVDRHGPRCVASGPLRRRLRHRQRTSRGHRGIDGGADRHQPRWAGSGPLSPRRRTQPSCPVSARVASPPDVSGIPLSRKRTR